MVKTRRPMRSIAGLDLTTQRLDEAAADRQAEAGPGPLSVAFRNAIKLVEQAVEILRWNARPSSIT